MGACKCAAALGLAGALAFGMPFGVEAATVEKLGKEEKMDDATWARLQDDVLEYDEIGNLVEYYNPSYRQAAEPVEIQAKPFQEAADELRKSAEQMALDSKDIKDLDPVTYQGMQEVVKQYRKAAESYENAVDSVHSGARHLLGKIKKLTCMGLQQMMNGYYQAAASREMLETAVALSQAACESALTQQALGMATATDVQAAEKSLQSAKGQLQTVDDAMANLKQQICIMTGWDYKADMSLGEIPQPDASRIEAMDPEADLPRAIGNSYSLIDLRGTSGKVDTNRQARLRVMDETEAKIKVDLEAAYQAVMKSRTAYEAARTALQSAEITMHGNDLKYQMGMLGRLEYLQLKMAYLQQKALARTAALDLTQAMENYGWIVEGLEIQSDAG